MNDAIDPTLATRASDRDRRGARCRRRDGRARRDPRAARCPTYNWVGIYLLDGNELVLGPFVGAPSPHTRIPVGRGICGAAAAEQMTIIVDDVSSDPRYLACSLETRSEIVVPIMHGGLVLGEIDIDSHERAAFGATDRDLLEEVASQLAVRLAARAADPR